MIPVPLIPVAAWFGTWFGRFTLGACVVASLVGLRVWDVQTQQAKGGAKAVAKIEKATTNASNLGKRAAAASTAGVRGQRDPTSRDD